MQSPTLDSIQKQRKIKDEQSKEYESVKVPNGIRIQTNPQNVRKNKKSLAYMEVKKNSDKLKNSKENKQEEAPLFQENTKKLQRSSSQHVFQPSRTYYGYKNENRFLKQQK